MIVESPEPDAKFSLGNVAKVQIVNECPVNVKSKYNGSKKISPVDLIVVDVVDVEVKVEVVEVVVVDVADV